MIYHYSVIITQTCKEGGLEVQSLLRLRSCHWSTVRLQLAQSLAAVVLLLQSVLFTSRSSFGMSARDATLDKALPNLPQLEKAGKGSGWSISL